MTARNSKSAVALAAYAVVLNGYLFLHPERELWHWLTLVLAPSALCWRLERPVSLRAFATSVGLDPTGARRGLWWAVLLGVLITAVQLLNRRQAAVFVDTIAQRPWLVALAFVLLLGTAAFTEEVFYRGLLLERLRRVQGPVTALAVSSLAFGLYHVPYLLRESGDPGAALSAALVLGGVGGLSVGGVYLLARGNLLAAILAHALFDLVPATAMLARLFP